ncbi:quinol dehydrogenase periplasmic component [compost metagenome]
MNRKEFMRLGGSHLRNALMGWFSSWEVPEEPRHVDPSPAPAALRGLRPPGAVAEERFLEACTHCGLCVEACPHDAIALAGARDDYPEGTPYLPNVAAKPCHLCEDMPCVAACETGALLRLSGEEVRMGLAEIDPDLCFAYRGQLCDYCIDRCPFPDEAIAADEHGRPVVNPDRCVGCGLCAYICVTTPGAIAVRPRTPRKEEPCSA